MNQLFRFAIIIAATAYLAGCASKKADHPAPGATKNGRANAAKTPAPNEDEVAIEDELEGNLFGKFFCDRAEFYVIHSPGDRIYSKEARALTLYYLDGVLSKKKYRLADDIHTELINKLGNFSITGFDRKNSRLIKSRQILVTTQAGLALNNALDNVELKWETGSGLVTYRVKLVNGRKTYFYTEKESQYDSHFRSLELSCG